MDQRTVGVLLVVLGVAAILVGAFVYSGALGWFGRLPGDVRVERESVRIYVPIVSMLILSVVLTLALWVIRRFMG